MNATRNAIIIAAFSVASKILGGLRIGIFSHYLGAGQTVDIYFTAFRFPDLLFNLLVMGTLSVAFIPVFVGYLSRDRSTALRIASTVFNFALAVMSVLVVLGILFAPILVRLIAPGFGAEAMDLTVRLTRVLLLAPLLFTLSSVLTGVLQSHKRFVLASTAPLLYNLSIIASVFVLFPRYGLLGLAWGAVFGAALHFAIQLPSAIRLGLQPFHVMDLGLAGVKKIGKLFLPRVFGLDLGQITLLVTSVVGSSLAAGSIAKVYYAYDLETIAVGVIAVAFSVAGFPVLSEYFEKKDFVRFRQFFSEMAVQVLFLMIPISVFILLLRAQIVRLVLGAGQNTQFSFADTRLTASALGFFTLSLFAQALIPLLSRAFFAMQNTVIPVVAGLFGGLVNVALAVFFIRYGTADVLALAFSGAAVANMLVLFVLLHKKLQGFDDEYLFLRVIKISIASIIMAVFIYASLYVVAPWVNMQTYLGIFIQTGVAAVVGVVVYLVAGFLIGLPESRQVTRVLRNWFSKFARPLTAAVVDMFTDVRG